MPKISTRKQRHGPRSRVFAHLSRYVGLADNPEWTGKTVDGHGNCSPLPSKNGDVLKTLESGCMQLYSFFSPGLPGDSYTTIVTQNISITQAGKTTTESTQKKEKKKQNSQGPTFPFFDTCMYLGRYLGMYACPSTFFTQVCRHGVFLSGLWCPFSNR